MVTVVTHVTLQPGREEIWDAAFRERAGAAKHQPGWIGVQLSIPPQTPNKRVVIGTWESRDDWRSWHATEVFKRTRERMVGNEAAPREQWWHEIAVEEHR